jgi:hypothetical protein
MTKCIIFVMQSWHHDIHQNDIHLWPERQNMTSLNDATSWSITLELSVTTLEPSIMFLENNYTTDINHDNRHLRLSCFIVDTTE